MTDALRDGRHPWLHDEEEILAKFDGDGFVRIPRGPFWFGDGERPTNKRMQEHDFHLAKLPITNQIADLFDPDSPTRFDDYSDFSGEPACPAIYMNWYDAWCLAAWLHSRLPDEFEWERACRGNQIPPKPSHGWSIGDDASQLGEVAWYDKNSENRTHPVGEPAEIKQPNDFGVYHMHGSVWEWTASWYDTNRGFRVLRGGAFFSLAGDCRASYRNYWPPTLCYYGLGLRVARA